MAYNRRIQVDIGRAADTVALRIEQLRISFDVAKDVKSITNRAKVQIYGLSDNSKNQIQELNSKIIIRAGYEDESLDEIFHGDISSHDHQKIDGELITTIEAVDGQRALQTSFSSVSYSAGTSIKRILQDAAKAFNLPIRTSEYLSKIEDQVFNQGFSFSGKSKALMDKLTQRAGLEWSIQGDQIQIIKIGDVVPMAVDQIPVLSPDSGLIESPVRIQSATSGSPEKRPPGWRIKSTLIGRIEPGGQVGLLCQDVPRATAFRVETVRHTGDSYGEEFFTVSEVVDPGVLL